MSTRLEDLERIAADHGSRLALLLGEKAAEEAMRDFYDGDEGRELLRLRGERPEYLRVIDGGKR